MVSSAVCREPTVCTKQDDSFSDTERGGGIEHTWKGGQTMQRNGDLQLQGPAGDRYQQ